MTVHYVDSGAWSKLLVEEGESQAMANFVDAARLSGDVFISSQLLATELHRLGVRIGVERARVEPALDQVALILPDATIFCLAGLLPGATLRTLDALHVAAALDPEADDFITYDHRQGLDAEAAGLSIVAPGVSA